MAEIRNLTRNGQTFYPLTHISAIVTNNGSGLVIENEPEIGNENLINSKGVAQGIAELGFTPLTDLPILETVSGKKLSSSGILVTDSLYDVLKYEVSAGEVIRVELTKDGDGVMQFQSDDTIPTTAPNSYLVGDVYTVAVNGMVKVPATATRLVVSKLKSNSSNIVGKYIEVENGIPETDSINLVTSGGIRRAINSDVPYIIASEEADTVETYYAINIKQGHTYRMYKTNNYSAVSDVNLCFRLDHSTRGQSYVTLLANAQYVDFVADQNYNYLMFQNLTTTAGGTEEIYFFDTNEFIRDIIEGKTTFSTGEAVSAVGIDSTPTENSNNLVESGGVYTELGTLQTSITNSTKFSTNEVLNNVGIDSLPTNNSNNLPKSGGVYSELLKKGTFVSMSLTDWENLPDQSKDPNTYYAIYEDEEV